MLNFEPTVTIDAQSSPGVRFTVKRLSQMERAKRDMQIAVHTLRIGEIAARVKEIREPYQAKEGEQAPKMPIEDQVEITKLDREAGVLWNLHVKPAFVRAGLVSVDGMTHGGKPVTADSLLEYGPDDLTDEVWLAVSNNASLTYEQAKNSPSPFTSTEQESGGEKSTGVQTASV